MYRLFTNTNKKAFAEKTRKIAPEVPGNILSYADKKADPADKAVTVFEYYYIAKKLKVDLSSIKYGGRGKPYFENAKHFGISHSGNVLAIAISDTAIGIDVQTLIPFDENTARLICNDEEYLSVINDKNPSRRLTALWVKKESLIKCKGEGFNQNLKDIFERNPDFKYRTKSYKNFELAVCSPIGQTVNRPEKI